ncbi:hypothetical protein BTHE_0665 [Bifidobacterium thermophilum]|nr:hypothetical protein BTHE_0665 [Bifidobacterium thermophilum]
MNRMARNRATACMAAICAMLACAALAGCTPKGVAVGASHGESQNVAHDSVDRQDVTIGVVGALGNPPVSDAVVMNDLAKAGLFARFASTTNNADATQAAQQAVRDWASQRVSVIVVNALNVTDTTARSWTDALGYARGAGVPVALLDPTNPPQDATLYAAVLRMGTDPAGSDPNVGSSTYKLDAALSLIINDNPHPATMRIG